MFISRAAQIAANILRAQCQDLGMADIQAHENGDVQAALAGRVYLFRWNVPSQSVKLVAVEPPMRTEIRL